MNSIIRNGFSKAQKWHISNFFHRLFTHIFQIKLSICLGEKFPERASLLRFFFCSAYMGSWSPGTSWELSRQTELKNWPVFFIKQQHPKYAAVECCKTHHEANFTSIRKKKEKKKRIPKNSNNDGTAMIFMYAKSTKKS